MIIKTILKKLREAELFEFLTSQMSHSITIQICQTLLNGLNTEPSMNVKQLLRSAQRYDADITMSNVKRVLEALKQAQIIVDDNDNLKFRERVVTEHDHDQKSPSAVPKSASASNQSSNLNQESVSADDLSARSSSSSSNDQSKVQSSDSDNDFLTGHQPSPLSSYFASVNSDLNDNYLKNDGYSSSSHGDHLVNRSNLDWLDTNSASSSVEQAAKLSKQDNHLNFATTPTSSESSAVSSSSAKSARTSSQSSSLNAQSSSNRASQGRSHHSKHSDDNRFRSIAKSLFQQVSFISLMSHPARVRKIAKTEFNLVVASRKYEGIKQADDLFKYEFKMNYQKFGKIGNRINNLLMKNISSHNN